VVVTKAKLPHEVGTGCFEEGTAASPSLVPKPCPQVLSRSSGLSPSSWQVSPTWCRTPTTCKHPPTCSELTCTRCAARPRRSAWPG